jgi:hypothetical protein
MSPVTMAPKLKAAVFTWWPFWIYCTVTVKTTGLPIKDVDANTWVVNCCPDPEDIVGKFQFEGPKILTELDWETRETAKSVIEFWRGLAIGETTALSLLMAKVTFCILPAAIWIGEGVELWEDEDGDWEEGSTLVFVLLLGLPLLALEGEWTKEATLVNISFPDEIAGETEYDGDDGEDGDGDDGDGDDGDGESGEGDTLNPDWGEIGNIWSPTSWFVIFLLP